MFHRVQSLIHPLGWGANLGCAALAIACGSAEPAPQPPINHGASALPTQAEAPAPSLDNYWSSDQAHALLSATKDIQLRSEALSSLKPGEQIALRELMAVGASFQDIFEQSRHRDALAQRASVQALRSQGPHGEQLADLYALFGGPIATTLDNKREPFAPVEAPPPGKNVYPWDVTKEEMDEALQKAPERRGQWLDERSVVRRRTTENIARDRAALDKHPVLRALHPSFDAVLNEPVETAPPFYAVPYAIAYADAMVDAHERLSRASEAVRVEDPDLSDFLARRAVDLLVNDYEPGDAAWVRGSTRVLNAQIGAYETYDDELYGVKAFYSMSVLARDAEKTAELKDVTAGLQSIEDALPYEPHRRVRDDIPIGVYEVVADFGQARGANTASILPNEARLARKYGRTILLRYNILTHPELFAIAKVRFQAAVASDHAEDLGLEGKFYRTLWHEIGHYLGPTETTDGRSLDEALEETSGLLEELKADLIALHVAKVLKETGRYSDERLRRVYASGIERVLQSNRPRPEQPYQTMQLMQMNYFLKRGVLSFDKDDRLTIDYGRYHETVTSMLSDVLALQRTGTPDKVRTFVAAYSTWEAAHQRLADRLKASSSTRFIHTQYDAIPHE